MSERNPNDEGAAEARPEEAGQGQPVQGPGDEQPEQGQQGPEPSGQGEQGQPQPPHAPPGPPGPYAPQAGPAPHAPQGAPGPYPPQLQPQPAPGAPYPPRLYPQGPPGKPPPDSAMWAHLSALIIFVAGTGACCIGFLVAWIGPLNIRNKAKDPFVRHHGTEGLNWGITQIAAVVVFGALMGGSIYMAEEQGWPEWVPALPMTAWGLYLVTSFAFAIVGCKRAKNGVLWSYPRLVALPFAKP